MLCSLFDYSRKNYYRKFGEDRYVRDKIWSLIRRCNFGVSHVERIRKFVFQITLNSSKAALEVYFKDQSDSIAINCIKHNALSLSVFSILS